MTGVSIATIIPIVFSLSVKKFPTRSNEISGLIMMAISDGAVIPWYCWPVGFIYPGNYLSNSIAARINGATPFVSLSNLFSLT